VQGLQRLREPATLVLLVVLGLRLLLGVVTFVVLARGGTDDTLAALSRGAYGDNSFALASFSLASSVLDGLSAVVLVGLVASCVLWRPTQHARVLTVVGLGMLVLGIVLSLVSAVVWLTGVRLSEPALADFFRLVLALAVPLLASIALWRMLPEGRGARAEELRQLPPADVSTRPAAAPELAAPSLRPEDQPSWQPEEAAGAAWLSAGDAATGAAASGWGTSGEQGWTPANREPAAPRREPTGHQDS